MPFFLYNAQYYWNGTQPHLIQPLHSTFSRANVVTKKGTVKKTSRANVVTKKGTVKKTSPMRGGAFAVPGYRAKFMGWIDSVGKYFFVDAVDLVDPVEEY